MLSTHRRDSLLSAEITNGFLRLSDLISNSMASDHGFDLFLEVLSSERSANWIRKVVIGASRVATDQVVLYTASPSKILIFFTLALVRLANVRGVDHPFGQRSYGGKA